MNSKQRWVIGDVHGCLKSLRALIEEKVRPQKSDQLIFVGDYIDRGPDSKGVVSYVMQLRLMGHEVVTLKGNHEDMLLRSIKDRTTRNNWFYNGGMATLQSFGVRDVKDIPSHFLEFMESLEYYYLLDDFIVVHAGLNFNIDDPLTDKESMLWIRNQYIDSKKIGDRKMVHGHTPLALDVIKKSIETGAQDIDIDNGCVYFSTEGLGNLLALELNSMRLEVQPNMDISF